MATIEEYKRREAEFMDRKDALCQFRHPDECNCNECPCKEMCNWLCNGNPYK